jgi:hypothetical protein
VSETQPPPDINPDEDTVLEMLPPKETAPARLCIVSSIYYQQKNRNPHSFEGKISRPLKTAEQVYTRHLTIGEEWTSLDTGWLQNSSCILITNEEGKHLSSNPTDEEALSISQRVIELGYTAHNSDTWLIHPKEFFAGSPSHLELRLRCKKGQAEITINIFPE